MGLRALLQVHHEARTSHVRDVHLLAESLPSTMCGPSMCGPSMFVVIRHSFTFQLSFVTDEYDSAKSHLMCKHESQRVLPLPTIIWHPREGGIDLLNEARVEYHPASRRYSKGIALRRMFVIQQHTRPGQAALQVPQRPTACSRPQHVYIRLCCHIIW